MSDAEELLKLSECARMLRVTEDTVRRLVAEKRLPALRVGRGLRFEPEAVLRALRGEGRRP